MLRFDLSEVCLFQKQKSPNSSFLLVKECGCHLQYPGDVAGSSTTVSKFNYFLPGGIRQRSTINKHTTKLVDATVTYMGTKSIGVIALYEKPADSM